MFIKSSQEPGFPWRPMCFVWTDLTKLLGSVPFQQQRKHLADALAEERALIKKMFIVHHRIPATKSDKHEGWGAHSHGTGVRKNWSWIFPSRSNRP